MSPSSGLRRLGPHVLVATSSFETTTSSVILGADHTALLVDPGVTPLELEWLAGELRDLELRVVAGISTHPHWDHLLWHDSWPDAPRFLHPDAAQRVLSVLPAIVREADETARGSAAGLSGWADGRVLDARPLSSGQLPWAGPSVRVLAHRAHAPGHLALVVGEGRDGVLLAGDMLSDVEIPLLDLGAADPLADYQRALAMFAGLHAASSVGWVIPGHGRVGTDLARRIAADNAYLDALCRDAAGSATAPAVEDMRLVGAPSWMAAQHAAQLGWVRATKRR